MITVGIIRNGANYLTQHLRKSVAYLREVLYRELAGRLRGLGYEPHGMKSTGFSVRGVEHLRERFSKRTRQVRKLVDAYAAEKGRQPTKKEVEVIVRESRPDKLVDISTAEVRAKQRSELNPAETAALKKLVAEAKSQLSWIHCSDGTARRCLEPHAFSGEFGPRPRFPRPVSGRRVLETVGRALARTRNSLGQEIAAKKGAKPLSFQSS